MSGGLLSTFSAIDTGLMKILESGRGTDAVFPCKVLDRRVGVLLRAVHKPLLEIFNAARSRGLDFRVKVPVVGIPASFQNTKNRGAVKIKSFCQFLGGNAFLILVANLIVAALLPFRKSCLSAFHHLGLCDVIDTLRGESVFLCKLRDLNTTMQCISNFTVAL